MLEIDRNLRRTLGERQRRLLQLGERKRARGKARFGGLDSAHRIAGQHQFHGAAHADQPRMKLHVGRAHQPHRRIADLRILGDEHHVAGGGELRAAGKAIAMHLRDHRLGEIPDREPAVHHMARPLSGTASGVIGLAGAVVGRQIVPCRKRRARPAHDHHRDVRIAIGGLQRLENLLAQQIAERVALLRPVEGDTPHPRQRIVNENMRVRGHCA